MSFILSSESELVGLARIMLDFPEGTALLMAGGR